MAKVELIPNKRL